MAFVGDVTPYEQRQPILGRYLSGQILGQLFGQAAGGVLGDWLGWRNVFFVLSAMFALSAAGLVDRKSTRLNSSHLGISYAVFCLKKKTTEMKNMLQLHLPRPRTL